MVFISWFLSGMWFDKSKKSWKMDSGPGSPFGLDGQSPLNLLDVSFCKDLQTLHIPTNKKLEVWSQYRLLFSFLGGYFYSVKNIFRQREIRKKSWEITGLSHKVWMHLPTPKVCTGLKASMCFFSPWIEQKHAILHYGSTCNPGCLTQSGLWIDAGRLMTSWQLRHDWHAAWTYM